LDRHVYIQRHHHLYQTQYQLEVPTISQLREQLSDEIADPLGGSLVAARRQWQRQRRWRQRNSTTSAVAAAHQRDVGGSMAAA
jgi:hypothetical protein